LIARVTTMRAGKQVSMATAKRRNCLPRFQPKRRQSQDVACHSRKAADSSRHDRLRGLAVVDDLPRRVPVSQRELDVIETYLGDLLDEALGQRG
jgi:hypothetical protein